MSWPRRVGRLPHDRLVLGPRPCERQSVKRLTPMPEYTPKEKFVGELVGSILGDWESLLPRDVVEKIHEEVAAAESERVPTARPASESAEPAERMAASGNDEQE